MFHTWLQICYPTHARSRSRFICGLCVTSGRHGLTVSLNRRYLAVRLCRCLCLCRRLHWFIGLAGALLVGASASPGFRFVPQHTPGGVFFMCRLRRVCVNIIVVKRNLSVTTDCRVPADALVFWQTNRGFNNNICRVCVYVVCMHVCGGLFVRRCRPV